MNEAVMKSRIREYAEKILSPMLVVEIEFYESDDEKDGETNIWLLTTDMDEEYWVLEGIHPSNVYKRSGIYQKSEQVLEAYLAMFEQSDVQDEQLDRFQMYQ